MTDWIFLCVHTFDHLVGSSRCIRGKWAVATAGLPTGCQHYLLFFAHDWNIDAPGHEPADDLPNELQLPLWAPGIPFLNNSFSDRETRHDFWKTICGQSLGARAMRDARLTWLHNFGRTKFLHFVSSFAPNIYACQLREYKLHRVKNNNNNNNKKQQQRSIQPFARTPQTDRHTFRNTQTQTDRHCKTYTKRPRLLFWGPSGG